MPLEWHISFACSRSIAGHLLALNLKAPASGSPRLVWAWKRILHCTVHVRARQSARCNGWYSSWGSAWEWFSMGWLSLAKWQPALRLRQWRSMLWASSVAARRPHARRSREGMQGQKDHQVNQSYQNISNIVVWLRRFHPSLPHLHRTNREQNGPVIKSFLHPPLLGEGQSQLLEHRKNTFYPCQSLCIYLYLSICLSIYRSIYHSALLYSSLFYSIPFNLSNLSNLSSLSIYLSFFLSIYLSVCLSVYLSVWLSVYLPFYLAKMHDWRKEKVE